MHATLALEVLQETLSACIINLVLPVADDGAVDVSMADSIQTIRIQSSLSCEP